MPGANPAEAVGAFLDPLRESMSCLGSAHFTLTRHAKGEVGETHAWTLNSGLGVKLTDRLSLKAAMHFETLDQGATRRSERFKVKTRGYQYALQADGREILGFHWHPVGSSHVTFPHLHFGEAALSDTGVFLARAHIPTNRRSFEATVRWIIEDLDVPPARGDWDEVLRRNEERFDQYKSWGKS